MTPTIWGQFFTLPKTPEKPSEKLRIWNSDWFRNSHFGPGWSVCLACLLKGHVTCRRYHGDTTKSMQDGWLENPRNLQWKNKKYTSKDLSVLGALKNVSGEQTVNSPWPLGVFPWQPDWCQCWSSKLHDSTPSFFVGSVTFQTPRKKSKLQRDDKKWYIWDAPAIILPTQIISISFLDLRVPTLSNPHFQHWLLENRNSHIPKFV